MWLGWFVVAPALLAGVAWRVGPPRARYALLIGTAVLHLGGALALWRDPAGASAGVFLAADSIATVMLLVTGVLFLASALYSSGTLLAAGPVPGAARLYVPSMLMFLAAMDLVLLSRHFGLMWVGVEATTLATAPLIHHARTPRSLEATWRYLLLCSVGIALALLGTFALGLACGPSQAGIRSLEIGTLIGRAATLDPAWLKIAFILLLVGYGTKMGLAPFHTWLPDAHGEAPAPVSALHSGALLNGAFVAVLRG
jgi:hydrogenase-4 component F